MLQAANSESSVKAMRSELPQSNLELFELLFDDLSDGVCISDSEFKIIYLNPAAQRMMESSAADMHNLTICEIMAITMPSPSIKDCVDNCPLRQQSSTRRSVTHRLEGLRISCQEVPPQLLGNAGRMHLTFIEDSSAKLDLERYKKDWHGLMAHELQAPLLRIVDALKSVDKPSAAQGLVEARRMLDLLNGYLEIALLEAGAEFIEVLRVNPLDIVCKAIDEQAKMALTCGIEVECTLPSDLWVHVDPDLLLKVARHLLSNALKATPKGGKIKITGSTAGAMVNISFKDTGKGIPPDELPYIFNRFYQARARREGRVEGTGLGLAFCQIALEAMRGRIYALSDPGRGSEFIIELPAA